MKIPKDKATRIGQQLIVPQLDREANERKAREIAKNIVGNDHYSYFDNFKLCAMQAMEWKDKDRTRRGDYFKKPTVYFYLNCKPTNGQSYQQTPAKDIKTITSGSGAIKTARKEKKYLTQQQYKEKFKEHKGKSGLCDEERSMISPDYARNFICDFILGKTQNLKGMQLSLF